jgi:hypothetical protein
MKRIFYCIILAFFALNHLYAQSDRKKQTSQKQVWYAYINTLELNNKWFIVSEIQERRFILPDKQHQFLTRAHLHYKFKNDWDGAIGFAYSLQSPNNPVSTSNLIIPEFRPHIEFNNKQVGEKLSFSHNYRAEWRFFRNTENNHLASGYWNVLRLRYKFGADYIVWKSIKKKNLKLKTSDEILINAGKAIVNNVFDQNRFFIGLNYQFHPKLAIEAGYMNLFQQKTTGFEFYNRNIARFTLLHKIQIR